MIEDGNYPNMGVGDRIEVAVECHFSEPATPANGELHATYTGESEDFEPTYAICADLVHRPSRAGWRGFYSPSWWQWRRITQEVVLDCGPFRVYTRSVIPEGVTRFVAQRATLEVDCFTYFERLALTPGFPPLIYTWTIDAILSGSRKRTSVRSRASPRLMPRCSGRITTAASTSSNAR